jgi:hypothetical protein
MCRGLDVLKVLIVLKVLNVLKTASIGFKSLINFLYNNVVKGNNQMMEGEKNCIRDCLSQLTKN